MYLCMHVCVFVCKFMYFYVFSIQIYVNVPKYGAMLGLLVFFSLKKGDLWGGKASNVSNISKMCQNMLKYFKKIPKIMAAHLNLPHSVRATKSIQIA